MSHAPRGIASQKHAEKPTIRAACPEGKLPDVVADFERVEAIAPVADERRIVVVPSLGPVPAAQVAQRFAELVGDDQAHTGDEQHVLPTPPRSERAANRQEHEHERRPALHERRRLGEPAELFELAISWSCTKNATGRSTKK